MRRAVGRYTDQWRPEHDGLRAQVGDVPHWRVKAVAGPVLDPYTHCPVNRLFRYGRRDSGLARWGVGVNAASTDGNEQKAATKRTDESEK